MEDGRKQLAQYQRVSNDNIMTCLKMRSPNQVLAMYQGTAPHYTSWSSVKVGLYFPAPASLVPYFAWPENLRPSLHRLLLGFLVTDA